MDVFEAMETCRSIRKIKSDPVPDEMLERLVFYATRAASAGNAQLWRFVVVTDQADREWFRDMLVTAIAPTLGDPPAGDDDTIEARNARLVRRFIFHWDRIPAFIITAVENSFPTAESPETHFAWSSVFTATQNLLLAARAMGLGAAMTTNHISNEPAVREHFGIPDSVLLGATIPVGFPEGKYGPLTRKPVDEVLFRNRWGAAWTTAPTSFAGL